MHKSVNLLKRFNVNIWWWKKKHTISKWNNDEKASIRHAYDPLKGAIPSRMACGRRISV